MARQGNRKIFRIGRGCLLRTALAFGLLFASISWAGESLERPFLQFLGGVRTIGGSACLLDTGRLRLLIDFGSFPDEKHREVIQPWPFDPASIDYILVTHAHMDHAGCIPLLYRKGFRGRVIGTDATRALLRITLAQSLKIMKEKGWADYEREDIDQMMRNYLVVPYDKKVSPSSYLVVRLRDAGHILGSAMFEIWIRDRDGPIKIVATGDMGSGIHPLLRPPALINEGDYVILESTYGTLRRENNEYDQFGREIQRALLSGGSVLIPAFALDRTQKVLCVLGRLKNEGIIPADVPIYTDSASAAAITRIYRSYRKYYGPALQKLPAQDDPLSFPNLQEVNRSMSLVAHDDGRPAIYVTSSGMLEHGLAPRHLERMIADERNLLAIVGWQAPGTLGDELQKGAGTVWIPVEKPEGGGAGVPVEKSVKMRIKTFDVFSGHADGCQILAWLSRFAKTKKVIVVHGEHGNALSLARAIRGHLGFAAEVPALGDVLPLSSRAADHPGKKRVLPSNSPGP